MTRRFLYFMLFSLLGVACSKGILDRKSDKSLVIPSTLDDFEALLNNTGILNSERKAMTEYGAADFYLPDEVWQSLSDLIERNTYLWKKDLYEGASTVYAWNDIYEQVLYANLVLDGLEDYVPKDNESGRLNEIRGSALFFRANAFLNGVMVFADTYQADRAASQPGIPLRLDSDLNKPTVRSNLQACYQQILDDLETAAAMLPDRRIYKTLPTNACAFAMLARTYLLMGNYEKALQNVEKALALHHVLLDYNAIDSTLIYPFTDMNEEVLYRGTLSNATSFRAPNSKVDSFLYRSYQKHDLRKTLFFQHNDDGSVSFRGSYIGSRLLFGGIATDELYLIKGECLARLGNGEQAMQALNTLLETRYVRNSFSPLTAKDAEEALSLVLQERRKELLLRGLRWSDLKRLNEEKRFKTTLYRKINGQLYELLPNDPRYVMPIPDYIIALTGMEQNPR